MPESDWGYLADIGYEELYFVNDTVKYANRTGWRYFDFVQEFPSQDNFTEESPLFLTFELSDETEENYSITLKMLEENTTLIRDLFAERVLLMGSATFSMKYAITPPKNGRFVLTYWQSFTRAKKTGIMEWDSWLTGTRENPTWSDRYGAFALPVAILVFDGIALMVSVGRFLWFIRRASAYARSNYVPLGKALVWKIDRTDIFNLFYQTLTLVGVSLYIACVGSDFKDSDRGFLMALAFAGFSHCLGFFRHLRMKKETWFVARLIFKSLGKTLLFVLGFLPFFYAWTILGISLFGHFSYLFEGFLRTCKILFSMMHTDVCMDTQEALKVEAAVPQWVTWVFAASWLLQTGGMVINILIALVDNALEELIEEG
jgi:hypothetical protein